MPSVSNQKAIPPDRILVIDDLPLIPLAFQEVFRFLNPAATIDYSENIFTALSAKAYANMSFDLVITDSLQDNFSKNMQQAVSELKKRFGQPLIMIYSNSYDPLIIEQMGSVGIDAYVHKYESIDEIRKAYAELSKGEVYISGIFHTMYYQYGLGVRR
jgi:DNA-binding NarL/FixJ family response regulator